MIRPNSLLYLAVLSLSVLAPLDAQRSVPDKPATVDKQALQKNLGGAKIQLADAIGRALERVPGLALRASFETARVDGKLTTRFEVEVLKDDCFYEIHVDPMSGAVTRVEAHGQPSVARAGEMVFDFEQEALPAGFKAMETRGVGTPAVWKTEHADNAPDGGRILIVDSANKKSTYNILMRRGKVGPDLQISTRIHSWKGEEDQGGGLLWRAKDEDNYYITRWNPLEDNLRLYTVVEGKRSLPIKSVQVKADPKQWHELEVTAVGQRIVVRFDGKVVLEAEDATFQDAGSVGLWTKADASTCFDSLRILPQRG